jgi:hypothetical protein
MRNLQTNESPIIDLKIKLKVHGKDELMLNGSSKIIRPLAERWLSVSCKERYHTETWN